MSLLDRVQSYIELRSFRRKWRSLNTHNRTIAVNIFDPRVVTVGRESYGALIIKQWGANKERLSIGSFVSIAENVCFLLGGNHHLNGFLTYPIYSKFKQLTPELDAQSKGAIIVDDDVWIGFGAVILSGVRLGRGVVVGAGSVVTKSFPEYAIVGGNPAKIIGFRLTEKEREIASSLDLENLYLQGLSDDVISLLYERPTEKCLHNINDSINSYSKNGY
ncbi:DapH/DapD/GlmU-related protein [Aeromonas sp. 95A]|uniref:DapH/DapD/GlmU-related protein n=1 Tax=Aeromonas sp. 95A TaxID=3452729 RepID=UPI003F7B2521